MQLPEITALLSLLLLPVACFPIFPPWLSPFFGLPGASISGPAQPDTGVSGSTAAGLTAIPTHQSPDAAYQNPGQPFPTSIPSLTKGPDAESYLVVTKTFTIPFPYVGDNLVFPGPVLPSSDPSLFPGPSLITKRVTNGSPTPEAALPGGSSAVDPTFTSGPTDTASQSGESFFQLPGLGGLGFPGVGSSSQGAGTSGGATPPAPSARPSGNAPVNPISLLPGVPPPPSCQHGLEGTSGMVCSVTGGGNGVPCGFCSFVGQICIPLLRNPLVLNGAGCIIPPQLPAAAGGGGWA